jgi:hypothetical protein
MQDAFYSSLAWKNSEKDQIVRMHRHTEAIRQVGSQRIGLGILGNSKACPFQFVHERCGPVRIVSRDVVANLIQIGDSARAEPNAAHLSVCFARIF